MAGLKSESPPRWTGIAKGETGYPCRSSKLEALPTRRENFGAATPYLLLVENRLWRSVTRSPATEKMVLLNLFPYVNNTTLATGRCYFTTFERGHRSLERQFELDTPTFHFHRHALCLFC